MRRRIGTPVERGVTELILELSDDVEDFSSLSSECLVVLPEDADVTLKGSQAPLRGIRSFALYPGSRTYSPASALRFASRWGFSNWHSIPECLQRLQGGFASGPISQRIFCFRQAFYETAPGR